MEKLSDNDSNLLKRSGAVVVDATIEYIDMLLKSTPLLGLAYGLAKGLIGNSMSMREKRVFEFMEPIVNNPSVFTNLILSSEEFQDGFVTTLQQYITIRTERKRAVVRKVFLDFGASPDKANFQIERFTDTVQKISPASLAVLGQIKRKIIPRKAKNVRKKLATDMPEGIMPKEW